MENYRPVTEKSRIDAVDILRGVAVLGILLINIVGFGLPDPAYFDPSLSGGSTGWDLRIFFINSILFEGAMRGMFSMLFGAGIILFMQKKEEEGAGLKLAGIWYRRLILLIIFGMIHAYLFVWPSEILFAYGMIGLLLFPFRNSAPRKLLLYAASIVLIGIIVNHGDFMKIKRQHNNYLQAVDMFGRGEKVPYPVLMDYYAWIEKYAIMKPGPERLGNRIGNMQKGYFSAVKEMAKDSYFFESEYHYRHNYLDILSMMLLGMALFKLRVFHAERTWKFYGLLVIIGYGIGIPINLWETTTYIQQDFSLLTYYQLLRTYDIGRIAVMMGHVGLVMLFVRSGILTPVRKLLSAAGRMALTNYVMQTVLANIIFIGFAQYGRWQRHELYYLVTAIWFFQLTFSLIWLRYFRYGPFEWAWRSLTYRKILANSFISIFPE
jgi:uncharacterized protein